MGKSAAGGLLAPKASAKSRWMCQGPVMPIGGAEDKSDGGEILERFVALAGGNSARIAIVPTASEEAAETGERYVGVFRDLGAAGADWLRIGKRADANEPDAVRLLEEATGIFITGGDQSRLVALLVGNVAMECIRQRNANGVVVAGTSAGASIVGTHLMSGGTGLAGNSNGAAARKGMAELVAGIGLLRDIIIDQHFSQRGRLGRLLSTFAANPGLLGFGLDEDTAVLIERSGELQVLGSNSVVIVDGRNTDSDYFRREVGEVLTIANFHLFVLGPGRRFDLDTRQPIDFNGSA